MDNRAYGKLDNLNIQSRLRKEYKDHYVSRPTKWPSSRKPITKQIVSQDIQIPAPVNFQTQPLPVPPILNEPKKVNSPDSYNTYKPLTKDSTYEHKSKRLLKKPNWKENKLQNLLVGFAVILFLSGIYIGIIGFKSDHIAQVQAAKLTEQANQAQNSTHSASSASQVPATVKPSSSSLANYIVAPNLPRYLKIPGLGVDARVLSVSVNSNGALETPDNVYDTAWYNESAEPGQLGATLIDGHISSWTAHGVFYGLKDLKPGDSIQIVRGDGTVFTYSVVKTEIYAANSVDMRAAMTPVVSGDSGLNLISCSGDVIPGTNLFNERIIVFSKLISS